ncbi:MAG: hypothetical protein M1834_006526 [Cirrosporium novae-zelandiae]|nr:MAG: hypothetical protein M1834_006526 [Cirrosporium novae-zelandiae]
MASTLSSTPNLSMDSLSSIQTGFSTPPGSPSPASPTLHSDRRASDSPSSNVIRQIIRLHEQGLSEDDISSFLESGTDGSHETEGYLTLAPATSEHKKGMSHEDNEKNSLKATTITQSQESQLVNPEPEAPSSPLFHRREPRDSFVPNAKVSMNTVLRSGTSLSAPSGWIRVN